MGTQRRIQKTIGYPTSDGDSFKTYDEAIKHQTDIDYTKACGDSLPDVELKAMRDFISNNIEVVQEYIKHHLTPKKPAPKKTAKPKAAANKTAASEAAK